jgi:hypothetical protein
MNDGGGLGEQQACLFPDLDNRYSDSVVSEGVPNAEHKADESRMREGRTKSWLFSLIPIQWENQNGWADATCNTNHKTPVTAY